MHLISNPWLKLLRGWRGIAILIIAAAVAWAIWGHHFDLNGTRYHRWLWRSVPGYWQYPVFLGLAIPFFLGQWLYHRQPKSVAAALALLMVSSFALMIAFAVTQEKPPSLAGIVHVVLSPIHGGYFEAADWLRDHDVTIPRLLAEYPARLPSFSLHPRNKPPGPLLFNANLIALIGSDRTTAAVSGLLIGLLATFSIPAVYAFVRQFTGNQPAAFAAASYFALSPGFLLIFPQYDQWFPIFTAGLTILWALAVFQTSLRPAVEFGLLLGLTLFVTYLPAVLAIFLAGCTLLALRNNDAVRWRSIILRCLAALGGFLAFYLILWIGARFDPIATFRACLRDEHENLAIMVSQGAVPRLWPGTIPGSFYDFGLGAGWIAYPIAAIFLISAIFTRRDGPILKIVLLCIAQFAAVGLLALIPCETARLWIFLLPMLLLPVGLELASWNFRWRMAIFVTLFVLTATAWRSMIFFR